jgi:hypothetical protein
MILPSKGFNNRSRSASVGSASFQDLKKAAITGQASGSWSLQGFPWIKASASITQKVESGECEPDLSDNPASLASRSVITGLIKSYLRFPKLESSG